MFSFGIITTKETGSKIDDIIYSIIDNCPTEKEIIVIGGKPLQTNDKNLIHVPFDETIKRSWITKKKNLITHIAKYDNVVYMHDYVKLCPGWSNGFLNLEPWDVCMSKITNISGSRFRDWVAWDDPDFGVGGFIKEKWCPKDGIRCGNLKIVPYDYGKTQYMYISGAYWVAKKEFMLQYPLNEELSWGEGEDVEWSYRARKTWKYKMNTTSSVRFNKEK